MINEDELLDEEFCGQSLLCWDCNVTHNITSACIKVDGLESLCPFSESAGLDSSFRVFRAVYVVIEDSTF